MKVLLGPLEVAYEKRFSPRNIGTRWRGMETDFSGMRGRTLKLFHIQKAEVETSKDLAAILAKSSGEDS